MTATERLRAMLDERGVEYGTEDRPTIRYTDWGDWMFAEPLDAKPHTLGAQCELMLIPATPEQAIEATLGRGECRNISPRADWKDNEEFMCSECGFDGTYELGVPNYCPNCGRKVRA